MDKGSCKVLKKNVKKPKESAVTTEHLPNKRVTEGSPAFAVLQALFLNTNDEKKSMSKEDIREKAQQFTRSNLTLNNKEDLNEWKTTWSGINALSGRMALIKKKVGQPWIILLRWLRSSENHISWAGPSFGPWSKNGPSVHKPQRSASTGLSVEARPFQTCS